MNKLFTKIATACVGLAMAVGVGVAVGSGSSAPREARAAVPATHGNWTLMTGEAIAAGDIILIATNDGNSYMKETVSSGHFQTNTFSASTPTKTGTCSILVESISGKSTFKLKMTKTGDQYVTEWKAGSGGGQFSSDDTTGWAFEWDSSGKGYDLKYNNTAQYLRSYNNSTFRTYTSKNGAVPMIYKWVDSGYTVTYKAGSGTGTDYPDTGKSGAYSLLDFSDCSFTAPSTYAFSHWSVKIGSASAVDKNPGDSITVDADTTATAQYVLGKELSYNGNGADGGSTNSTYVKSGGTQVVSSCGFTKDGYAFKEWNTASNGTGTKYDPDDEIENFTSDLELYAIWKESTSVTYDFTKISGFSDWGNGYNSHSVEYTLGTVTFSAASKQTSTISDRPVTKGQPVSFVGANITITSVTFECQQWGTKAQTITLHYSTDGGETYTSTGITSDNFTISKSNLPTGTNAVKITFSNSSNQVGISSLTIDYARESNIEVSPSSGTVKTGNTLNISSYVSGTTGTVTYESNNTAVATVSASGVITPVAYGTTTITIGDDTSGTGTFTVTVISLKFSTNNPTSVEKDDSVTIAIEPDSNNGNVTWTVTSGTGSASLSDQSNASVTVTGLTLGTVTLQAQDSSNTISCTLTVTNASSYTYGLGQFYVTVNDGDTVEWWLELGSYSDAPAGNSATALDADATVVSHAWSFVKATGASAGNDHYQITDGTNYLYLTGSNNGVRTQTTVPDSYWLLESSDIDISDGIDCTLKYIGTSRYLAINTTTGVGGDFRCYTSTTAGSTISTITLKPVKTLSGLSISGTQSTTSFKAGSSFVPDQTLIVSATYSYGGTKSFTTAASNVTWTPSPLTAGDDQNVVAHATYRGHEETATSSFTIDVEPAAVDSISITTLPDKRLYYAGELFDITSLVVTGYDDQSQVIGNVTAACSYFVGETELTVGSALPANILGENLTVTVIYDDDDSISDTFTINVYSHATVTTAILTGINQYSTVHVGDITGFGAGSKYNARFEATGVYNNGGFQINTTKTGDGYIKNLASMPGSITKIALTWATALSTNTVDVYFSSSDVASKSDTKVTISGDDTETVTYAELNVASDYKYFYIDLSQIGANVTISHIDVVYKQHEEGVALNFADYYLHMNDISTSDESDTNACRSEGEGALNYYSLAKTAYGGLSEGEKSEFASMTDAVARFKAWATANEETFNEASGTFTKNQETVSALLANITGSTESTAAIVVISVISVAAVGGYFFLRRRKEI